MSRTHAPLALLVALTLALTGCGGVGKGLGKAGPSPAPTAAFASEEEALAAATSVYSRYVEIGDEIGHDGGRDSERFSAVVVGEFLDQSVEGLSSWGEKGWRQVGSTTFRDVELQQYSTGPTSAVIVYLCEDLTDVDVVDATGSSIVSADRPDTYYFQVIFDVDDEHVLRISGRERWDDRKC